MPPVHGEVNARYEQARYFVGIGWGGRARQNRVASDEFETTTGGYSTWSAVAGYRFTAFNRVHAITLRGENLGDELYYDHLSRAKELFPGPGRNLSVVYRVIF